MEESRFERLSSLLCSKDSVTEHERLISLSIINPEMPSGALGLDGSDRSSNSLNNIGKSENFVLVALLQVFKASTTAASSAS